MPHGPSVTRSTAARRRHRAREPFQCTWSAGGARSASVQVAGEVDLATAPKLRQSLEQAQLAARLVMLDLRDLTFMDSAGVHAILEAASRARRTGGRLVVVRGSVQVSRLLTLTGADSQIPLFEAEPTP